MKRTPITLTTYEIKILKDGQHVDTQTVEATDEGQAISVAMCRTHVRFDGAEASYEGREQGGAWRVFRNA